MTCETQCKKPINVDRNIKPSDYNFLKENEVLITNIFYTLQGEGIYGGHPACFVRFAGCNLGGKGTATGAGCEFCDTIFYFDKGKVLTFEQILTQVKELTPEHCKLIVITGGEPMLQPNIIEFTKFLNENEFNTQFESNGTIYRDIPRTHNNCFNTVVVSPKLGASLTYNIRPDVFERADVLKIMIEPEGKFSVIPSQAFEARDKGKLVYLSPINVYNRSLEIGEVPSIFDSSIFNIPECRKNYAYVTKLCMEHAFRLNLQQHLFVCIE